MKDWLYRVRVCRRCLAKQDDESWSDIFLLLSLKTRYQNRGEMREGREGRGYKTLQSYIVRLSPYYKVLSAL